MWASWIGRKNRSLSFSELTFDFRVETLDTLILHLKNYFRSFLRKPRNSVSCGFINIRNVHDAGSFSENIEGLNCAFEWCFFGCNTRDCTFFFTYCYTGLKWKAVSSYYNWNITTNAHRSWRNALNRFNVWFVKVKFVISKFWRV